MDEAATNLHRFQPERFGQNPKHYHEWEEATFTLQTETETFYVFARMLLDDVARAIQWYFGGGQGCSLASHHKLIDNFCVYTQQKKIIIDANFLPVASGLKSRIGDYRDKRIAHLTTPNVLRAIVSSTVDDPVTSTYLSDFLVCPDDRQASPDKKTEPLLTLLADVDKYLLLFEQLIRAN